MFKLKLKNKIKNPHSHNLASNMIYAENHSDFLNLTVEHIDGGTTSCNSLPRHMKQVPIDFGIIVG
jgi:hypothetical protein